MSLTRRDLLVGALTTGAAACVRGGAVKTKVPAITHGVQSGDVSDGNAIVWARCDEPARMQVEWSTTDRFDTARRVQGPLVDPARDLTGHAALAGLPAGQTIHYRIKFEREAARGASAWAMGTLQTPRADGFRFAWTGDTCGQGYGRNPDWGGLRGYKALHESHPRFFLNSGDMMYADNPILPEQQLPTGGVWKNISNERVARVAQELDDFRARFAYNLEDDHVRAFYRDVSMIASFDDHEVKNDWFPGRRLDDDARYQIKEVATLAERSRRAAFEWVPIQSKTVHRVIHYGPLLDVIVLDVRTFRSPNNAENLASTAPGSAMLGAEQATWLVEALSKSKATWKIVASPQPVGLVITDGDGDTYGRDGYAGGEGLPTGREIELAQVLRALQARRVKNVAWLTADVHYAAAHHYDPARAQVAEFDPFWEFVAGPIHAGTFGPNELDQTLGGEVRFQWAPPPKSGNLPPWEGLQSFGTVDVAPEALVVSLWGIDGKRRYRVELPHVA